MKKIMSRFLMLVALVTCLGLVAAADFRTKALDPYCPEGCHNNCRTALANCEYACDDDEDCIRKCQTPFNNCINYCNWVCGPE